MKKIILISISVIIAFSASGKPKKNNYTQVAMIMVEKVVLYSKSYLETQFKKDWKKMPSIRNFAGKQGTSIFDLGKYKVVIAAMLTPIPEKELEYPLNTVLFWKNARNDIKKHKRHYVVYVSSPYASKIDVNLMCTRIVKTLTEMTGGIGVYWGSSSQIIKASTFNAYCSLIEKKSRPVPIWVKVTGYRKKDNTYYVYTVGLHAFGHRELEIQSYRGTFKDVYFFMLDLADYILKKKRVIRDGDTVGTSSSEKLKIRFKKSDLNNKIDVMSIDFQ